MHLTPNIAALVYWGFVFWLFRRESRQRPNVTGAMWLPFIWIFLISSRTLSQWLELFGLPTFGGGSVEDGTPLDAVLQLGLMVSGVAILNRRQFSFGEFVRKNPWCCLYLAYCCVSVVWSDFPFVAFKRWFKVLGDPIMILLILTEPDPVEALVSLLMRCVYILIPISILLIKYYDYIGRSYDDWTGLAMNTGITNDKNMLGADCFILGIFLAWHFLRTWRLEKSRARRDELLLTGFLLYLAWWLMFRASSATSLMTLAIGTFVLIVLTFRFVNRQYIGSYIVGVVVGIAILQLCFGVFSYVFGLLDRNSTLTGRTQIWAECLSVPNNPILGAGYGSFWLGDRLKYLWSLHWWHAIQAHNGYLETYLDLGAIGECLLLAWILGTFFKIRRQLVANSPFGPLWLALFIGIVIYNWTEAAYTALGTVMFAFYLVTTDYPMTDLPAAQPLSEEEYTEDEKAESAGSFTTAEI